MNNPSTFPADTKEDRAQQLVALDKLLSMDLMPEAGKAAWNNRKTLVAVMIEKDGYVEPSDENSGPAEVEQPEVAVVAETRHSHMAAAVLGFDPSEPAPKLDYAAGGPPGINPFEINEPLHTFEDGVKLFKIHERWYAVQDNKILNSFATVDYLRQYQNHQLQAGQPTPFDVPAAAEFPMGVAEGVSDNPKVIDPVQELLSQHNPWHVFEDGTKLWRIPTSNYKGAINFMVVAAAPDGAFLSPDATMALVEIVKSLTPPTEDTHVTSPEFTNADPKINEDASAAVSAEVPVGTTTIDPAYAPVAAPELEVQAYLGQYPATRGPRPKVHLLNATTAQLMQLFEFLTPEIALSIQRRLDQGKHSAYAAIDLSHVVRGNEGFFYDANGIAFTYAEIVEKAGARLFFLNGQLNSEEPASAPAVVEEKPSEPEPFKLKYALCIPAWQRFVDRREWTPVLKDRFGPTDFCEKDNSFLQILPYVTVQDRYGRLFSYLRGKQGDEKGLIDMRSLGGGGHIDSVPPELSTYLAPDEAFSEEVTALDMHIVTEAQRELREEFGLDVSIGALLSALDDSFTMFYPKTDVDSRHLAISLTITVEDPAQLTAMEAGHIEEPDWVDRQFAQLQTMVADMVKPESILWRFETWSAMYLHITSNQETYTSYQQQMQSLQQRFTMQRSVVDLWSRDVVAKFPNTLKIGIEVDHGTSLYLEGTEQREKKRIMVPMAQFKHIHVSEKRLNDFVGSEGPHETVPLYTWFVDDNTIFTTTDFTDWVGPINPAGTEGPAQST